MTRIGDIPLFDASHYLDTSEARAEYLTAVLETGTPDEIGRALDVVARAARADEASTGSDAVHESARQSSEFGAVVRMMRTWGIGLTAAPLARAE